MKNRTLEITIGEDPIARARAFAKNVEKGDSNESADFVSLEVFNKYFSANRIALVKALRHQGYLGLRELARRVGRDVKGVHSDIVTLADTGIVERDSRGKVSCPFDKIVFKVEGDPFESLPPFKHGLKQMLA
jgi:predicted transcriptional regulator